jgi:hypothetical protein
MLGSAAAPLVAALICVELLTTPLCRLFPSHQPLLVDVFQQCQANLGILLSNSKNFKEILFFKCWKNFHFFLLLYRFMCHNSIYIFFEENYVSFASENVAKVYITI